MMSFSCLCMLAFSGSGINSTPGQDTPDPIPPTNRRPLAGERTPAPLVRPPVPTPSVAPLEEPVPLEEKKQNNSNIPDELRAAIAELLSLEVREEKKQNNGNIRGNDRIIGTGQFGILKNVKNRFISGDKLFQNSKWRLRQNNPTTNFRETRLDNENPTEGEQPITRSDILEQGIPVNTSRYLKLNNNTDKVAKFYFQLKFDKENGNEWTSKNLGEEEESFKVVLNPGESQVIMQSNGFDPLPIQKARIWATTENQKYLKFQKKDLDLMITGPYKGTSPDTFLFSLNQ